MPITNPNVDMLRLAAEGLTGSEIGKALGYSEDNVKSHMLAWRAKLGAKSTLHAVVIASRRGLIDVGADVIPCGQCGHVRAVLMGHLPQRRRTLPTSDFALLFDEIRGIYRTREDT